MLDPAALGLAARPFDDLLPVADLDATVGHFLALIGGDGPVGRDRQHPPERRGAGDQLRRRRRLAARRSSWRAETMRAGEPAALIERMRSHGKPTVGRWP